MWVASIPGRHYSSGMDGAEIGMYAMHGFLAGCALIVLGLAVWLAYVITTGRSSSRD